MIAVALAAFAQAAAASASVPPLALLETYEIYCHDHRSDRGAAASATGFTPVAVLPGGAAGRETAAWEKEGIRLFEMAGRADPYLLAPATCGVSANIGAADPRASAFENQFSNDPAYFWLEVTHHDGRIYWNLLLRAAGAVRGSFDESRPDAVRMTLSGTGESLPQASPK